MAKTIASIEARMGSSRLPGKVTLNIDGVPLLQRLIQRVQSAASLDGIVLATTTLASDDILESLANECGIHCFRGSEDDVLQRVIGAHDLMNSTTIVELTGDCPLLDPEIIDLSVNTYFNNNCDVVTNTRLPGFPQGVDVQVFSYSSLLHVEQNIFDPAVREHVSLYFYENPSLYHVYNLLPPTFWSYPNLRLQVDYPEDFQLITEIFSNLIPMYGDSFGLIEVLRFLKDNPTIANINAHCLEKSVRL